MSNSSKNSKKGIIVAVIAIALVAVIGGSYALFRFTTTATKTNVIEVGTLTLQLDESASEGILIQNAVPVTEDYAKANYTAYTFIVKNTGTINAKYDLSLIDNGNIEVGKRLADSNVKYSLTSVKKSATSTAEEPVSTTALLSTLTDRKLNTNIELAAGESVEYTLYLWIDEDATEEIAGQQFSAQVKVDAVQNVE
jgi:hypothetical protein